MIVKVYTAEERRKDPFADIKGDMYEVEDCGGDNIEKGDLYVAKRNYPHYELMTCEDNDRENRWIVADWKIDGVHYSYDTLECHKVIKKID